MKSTRALATGVLLCLLGMTSAAGAGEPAADKAPADKGPDKAAVAAKYREGELAFVQRDFKRSAAAFMEAFRMNPHPNALSNASNAYERAGDLANAITATSRILREFPTSELAVAAAQRVARFRKQLTELDITLPSGGTELAVDGVASDYLHPFVVPGRHEVTARFPTGEAKAVVDAKAGETARVALEAPAPIVAPHAPPGETGPKPPPTASDSSGPPLHPAIFFAGLGVTAVAGGVLTWSGLDTVLKRDQFDSALTQEAHDEGVAAQTRTNVLIGVTSGLGALTLAAGLFLTDWRVLHADNPFWGRTDVRLIAGPGTGFLLLEHEL